jgi:serine/tyrosine/threonine adenylyltransferase
VLRNWIALEAIDAAEQGDFTVVQSVLDNLTRPSAGEGSTGSFAPPVWAADLICTCSS